MSHTEISRALASLPEWRHENGGLIRDVTVAADTRDLLVRDLTAVADEQGGKLALETTPEGVRLLIATRASATVDSKDIELAAALDQVLSGTARHHGG